MKLILHIGTEKTGTTSMQRWFVANRAALLRQGVWYPTSLGPESHRDLAIAARDPDKLDDGARRRGVRTASDWTAFCARLTEDFAAEFRQQAAMRCCVISSEHLQSRLTSEPMVRRLPPIFGDRFSEIEILIHLRPQIDVAVSLASTAARMGQTVSSERFEHVSADDHFYRYDRLVQRWAAVFGADAVRLVAFKRQPSLTELLIAQLRIDRSGLQPAAPTNEALDWRSIAIVNALAAADGIDRDELRALYIDDWPGRERLQLGRALAQRFQAVFSTSNDALIAQRQDLAPGDLTPDWEKYSDSSNLDRAAELVPFGAQLQYLVRRLRSELLLEQCAREVAEARLAAATDDLKQVRAHVERTRALTAKIPLNDITAPRLAGLKRWIEALSAGA